MSVLALFNFGNAVFSAVGDTKRSMRPDGSRVRAIVSLCIPSGMQSGIFARANLFIQTGVNSFSATMVAGNSAATNADALIYNVMAAFYTACGSFIGQNYGAGNPERVSCAV